ncbi:MAG: ATP-binding protein [Parachlamydiales bacterium]|nr:ATP-binding protein [Parachlamydiales bacterium]
MKDNIKQAIRSILNEFEQRDLPKPVPREISPPPFQKINKAWVLMGMRRSGKTWSAYQHIQLRQNQGLPKNTNLYVNFEDDRLAGFEISHFQIILDTYFELYPQNINRQDLFFCFDEIHIVPGWEKFIRRLIDTEKMQICVTGSSAEMLSKELGTTLGGRAWPQEVFPFSFSEFLQFHAIEPNTIMNSKTQAQIRHLATEYLLYGGFPEVILGPKELHNTLIQGYIDAVILRDIVKRYAIRNADIIQKFIVRILRQLATPLSITKVYNTLKSIGLAVGKNSLFEYFQYFEDAYAILSAPFFSLSEKVRQVNPKKVYAVDPGIITAYSIKNDFEKSARLENAVFIHLRRTFNNICYYKTKHQKKEVDFVITRLNGELILIQACVKMDDLETRERELSALIDACREFGLNQGTIITEDHEEAINQEGIAIQCIPFWKWAQVKLAP